MNTSRDATRDEALEIAGDYRPFDFVKRDVPVPADKLRLLCDYVKSLPSATGSEPTAYLFNGTLYWPDGLTDEQRARATPLYQSHPSSTGAFDLKDSLHKVVNNLMEHGGAHYERMFGRKGSAIFTNAEVAAIREVVYRALEAQRLALSATGSTSQWVPVSERLPEKYGRYLCWHHGHDEPEFFVWDGQWCYDFCGQDPVLHDPNVTHWMPIPELPATSTKARNSDG